MSVFIQEVLGLLNRNKKKITLDKNKDWFQFGKLYSSSSLNQTAYAPQMEPFAIKWGDFICQSTEDMTRTLPGEGKFSYIPVYTDPSGTCSHDTLKDSIITQTALTPFITRINIAGDLTVTGIGTFFQDIEVNNIVVGIGGGNLSSNTAVGYRALVNNTTGAENTAIGNEALRNNITGSQNTAVGEGALKQNQASENTAIGQGVLQLNSAGQSNTGLGAFALNDNVSGSQNTAIGTRALKNNLSTNNTAVGVDALIDNTTGSNNVAVGVEALHNNVVGTSNIAIGVEALRKNNQSSNLAIGTQTLYNNTIGVNNVALGQQSLFNNESGGLNLALGLQALYVSKTGSNNIGIGQSSLSNLKFGSNNIGIGIATALLDKSDNNSIVIGNFALGIGSNKTVLGTPSTIQTFIRGRVTLNTTADNGVDQLQIAGYASATGYKVPGGTTQFLKANGGLDSNVYALDSNVVHLSGNETIGGSKTFSLDIVVNGISVGKGAAPSVTNTRIGQGALSTNATGAGNSAVGYQASLNATGSNNTVVGAFAGQNSSTGADNVIIGNSATLLTASNSNSIVIGKSASGLGDNTTSIGNSSITTFGLFGNIRLLSGMAVAPASATAAGTLGDIRVTSGFIYVCIATNTWVRTALTTW